MECICKAHETGILIIIDQAIWTIRVATVHVQLQWYYVMMQPERGFGKWSLALHVVIGVILETKMTHFAMNEPVLPRDNGSYFTYHIHRTRTYPDTGLQLELLCCYCFNSSVGLWLLWTITRPCI